MFLHCMQLFRRDYPEAFVKAQEASLQQALQVCNQSRPQTGSDPETVAVLRCKVHAQACRCRAVDDRGEHGASGFAGRCWDLSRLPEQVPQRGWTRLQE